MEELDTNSGKKLRLVTFSISSQTYAFPLEKVVETINTTELFPIPKTNDYILGAISYHEKIVTVIDFIGLIGLGKTMTTDTSCILIIDLIISGEVNKLGILVEDAPTPIAVIESTVSAFHDAETAIEATLITSIVSHNSENVKVIDAFQLPLYLDMR
jgi:purine-binding chemotaxis protein CheW